MELYSLTSSLWRLPHTQSILFLRRWYSVPQVKTLCTFLRRDNGISTFTSSAKPEIINGWRGFKNNGCVQQQFLSFNYRQYTTRPYEVNTDVKKDVILFRYVNPKWYKILYTFALSQFCFWSYSAYMGYTMLKDVPVKADVSQDLPFWRRINLGENKYRYGFTVLSLLIASTLMTTACLYTAKSVKYLILRKGGRSVTIITHGIFGRNLSRTVDLEKVSCPTSRASAKAQLPIAVKGNYVNYILDMRGEFTNPQLFDYTAGLKRNL